MSRLTTEKDVKEMGMYELAHNSCYAKDGKARYRDFETDIDCRDLARKLMVDYGLWKSIPEHGLDAHNELVDDDIFDESILENLWYGLDTLEGLIALFYRNLWAMADLRTKLKHYEDLEEAGRLYTCKLGVGGKAYLLRPSRVIEEYIVLEVNISRDGESYFAHSYGPFAVFNEEDIGETWFLTKEEAERKLKELEGSEVAE